MINTIEIEGTLTNNPTYNKIAKFGLAVHEKKDKTFFIDCVGFKEVAEDMIKELRKGQKVIVRGRFTINEWKDKKYPQVLVNEYEIKANAPAPKEDDVEVAEENIDEKYADINVADDDLPI